MVQEERVRVLNTGKVVSESAAVVYWMAREQRAEDNWPLQYALEEGRRRRIPTVVVFSLEDALAGCGSAQARFMLVGLKHTAMRLEGLGIPFFLLEGGVRAGIKALFDRLMPALVVVDFDPLKPRRALYTLLQEIFPGPFHQVDGHNIVPVWRASDKREYAARTIRPKINRLLPEFLLPFSRKYEQSAPYSGSCPDIQWDRLFVQHQENQEYPVAGGVAGKRRLVSFLKNKLDTYEADRNNPNRDATSGLSPYFHFGQIAPQRAALEAVKMPSGPGLDAFLEELIIRRELSDNYCHYTADYDAYSAMPAWAQKTLEAHRMDPREYIYSREEFEAGDTHDPLWNAAQLNLVRTGRMHGYLRMYWAKKILEWTPDPETALALVIFFNDRHALDGCDPNGYVGAAWSVAGLHDRPWGTRPIFGSVRFMSYSGCRRKFDVDAYEASILGSSQKELF